jgi:hypothetical protein
MTNFLSSTCFHFPRSAVHIYWVGITPSGHKEVEMEKQNNEKKNASAVQHQEVVATCNLVGGVYVSRSDWGSNIKTAVNIWSVSWYKQCMVTTYIVMEELWTCVKILWLLGGKQGLCACIKIYIEDAWNCCLLTPLAVHLWMFRWKCPF